MEEILVSDSNVINEFEQGVLSKLDEIIRKVRLTLGDA